MRKPNSEPRKVGGLLFWMCDIADVNIWRGTLRTEATFLVPLNFHGWSVPWNLDDLGLPESEPKIAIWRRTPSDKANGCFQIHGASKMIHFWWWIFHETIQIYPAIGVPPLMQLPVFYQGWYELLAAGAHGGGAGPRDLAKDLPKTSLRSSRHVAKRHLLQLKLEGVGETRGLGMVRPAGVGNSWDIRKKKFGDFKSGDVLLVTSGDYWTCSSRLGDFSRQGAFRRFLQFPRWILGGETCRGSALSEPLLGKAANHWEEAALRRFLCSLEDNLEGSDLLEPQKMM